MTKFTKVLLFIYIATFPVSSALFDAIALPLGDFGRVSLIDMSRFFLVIGLLNSNKFYGIKQKSIITQIGVFLLIIISYNLFKNLFLGNTNGIQFTKSAFKVTLQYLPMLLLINKFSYHQLGDKFIYKSVLTASVLVLISMIFKKSISSFYGLSGSTFIIKELDVERSSGYFALGDLNSMAIFQVMITAYFIIKMKLKKDCRYFVISSIIISLMTIGHTASRGAFVAIILMLFFIGGKSTRVLNLLKYISLASFFLLIFYFINPKFFEPVVYRFFESGTTEKDLDTRGNEGRIANMASFVEFALTHKDVLWIGDVNRTFKFGNQTVHNAFLQMLSYAGIFAFALFLYYNLKFIVEAWRNRLLAIYVPVFVGLMTLPDSGNIFYLILLWWSFLGFREFTSFRSTPKKYVEINVPQVLP